MAEQLQLAPYVSPGSAYDEYAPAYRHGWEARSRHGGKRFEEVESSVRTDWEATKGKTRLEWDRAKAAMRDAWDHVGSREHENVNDDATTARTSGAGISGSGVGGNVRS